MLNLISHKTFKKNHWTFNSTKIDDEIIPINPSEIQNKF